MVGTRRQTFSCDCQRKNSMRDKWKWLRFVFGCKAAFPLAFFFGTKRLFFFLPIEFATRFDAYVICQQRKRSLCMREIASGKLVWVLELGSKYGEICNIYHIPGRSVSVYTDTSALLEHLRVYTQIQNGNEYCKLLIKRPQIVLFSNYVWENKC